jgi:hypothetical protein
MQNVKNLKIILNRVVQDFKFECSSKKKENDLDKKNEKLSLQKV